MSELHEIQCSGKMICKKSMLPEDWISRQSMPHVLRNPENPDLLSIGMRAIGFLQFRQPAGE